MNFGKIEDANASCGIYQWKANASTTRWGYFYRLRSPILWRELSMVSFGNNGTLSINGLMRGAANTNW